MNQHEEKQHRHGTYETQQDLRNHVLVHGRESSIRNRDSFRQLRLYLRLDESLDLFHGHRLAATVLHVGPDRDGLLPGLPRVGLGRPVRMNVGHLAQRYGNPRHVRRNYMVRYRIISHPGTDRHTVEIHGQFLVAFPKRGYGLSAEGSCKRHGKHGLVHAEPGSLIRIQGDIHMRHIVIHVAVYPFQYIIQRIHVPLDLLSHRSQGILVRTLDYHLHRSRHRLVVHLLESDQSTREIMLVPGLVLLQYGLGSHHRSGVHYELGIVPSGKLRGIGGMETR